MERRSDVALTGGAKITGLPAGTATGHAVEYDQFNAAIQGIRWKNSVRAASTANINLAAPGTTIDGVTMANGDRFMPKDQSTQTQNGIYIFNGAAAAATRSVDADTFLELESAIVGVEEGTANAGTQWRQTQVNGVIGTNNIIFTSFQASAPSASETTAGIAEIATQTETDTGTDDLRMVTPLKLATWSKRKLKFTSAAGNGSLTQIDITHNLGTTDITFRVYVASSGATISCDATTTDGNTLRLNFVTAPTSSELKVVIIG